MIDELLTKQASPEHIAKYGGYNDKPPNWTSLTEEEFSRCDFFTYTFTSTEFRQFKDPENNNGYNGFQSVRLYFMPAGHGYGIYSDWQNERVRFFRFGCKHQYRGLDQAECRARNIPHYGRCYSVAECVLCGHIYATDSSD